MSRSVARALTRPRVGRCRRAGMLALSVAVAACSADQKGEDGASAQTSAFRPIAVGSPAPAYANRVFDGDSLRVGAGGDGTLTLLNVWATWCIPCRREFPALERLHREWGPRGLRVVGVSVDAGGTDDRVRQTARDLGGSFPIARDPDGTVQDVYRTIGVPESYLLAPDGTLLWRHIGDFSRDTTALLQIIQQQLAAGR